MQPVRLKSARRWPRWLLGPAALMIALFVWLWARPTPPAVPEAKPSIRLFEASGGVDALTVDPSGADGPYTLRRAADGYQADEVPWPLRQDLAKAMFDAVQSVDASDALPTGGEALAPQDVGITADSPSSPFRARAAKAPCSASASSLAATPMCST